MSYVKYSKSLNDIFRLKNDFFKNDKFLLKQADDWNKFYSIQTRRKNVKIVKKLIRVYLNLILQVILSVKNVDILME